MERRNFIAKTLGIGFFLPPLINDWSLSFINFKTKDWILKGPPMPVFIYNNWSAYDELSDNIPQTEKLAMRELMEIVRLKKNGVSFDYYVMDAFWFDKWGGYRTWHKEHWPKGPDNWLASCKQNNILPGLWFSTNLIATQSGRFLEVIPEWEGSLDKEHNIMCLFQGGYLKHLAETLQYWYNKGVRLFKFDFAYFEAATDDARKKYSEEEIKEKNKAAFLNMLQDFHSRNTNVLITGYNGFGGDMENTFTEFKRTVDHRWLNVFDTLYCGDPRFSDVPMMNIWRSQDLYSDHMVRQFEFNGLPLNRIDCCAFMIGLTGTCYNRGHNAWRGMLILELARSGWVNVYHGNLELLNNEDARWFAKVQSLFHELQKENKVRSFGAIPGKAQTFGYVAESQRGLVYTIVNPSQQTQEVQLPVDASLKGRVLYHDAGFVPSIHNTVLTMGSEQLVVIGYHGYADAHYDLGVDTDIKIPKTIEKMEVMFSANEHNSIVGQCIVLPNKNLRVIVQQFGTDGLPRRSWGGAPPDGKRMNELIRISMQQEGKLLPLHIPYDKMIWSGLSWGVAEAGLGELRPSSPITITCNSSEKDALTLKAEVYVVSYA